MLKLAWGSWFYGLFAALIGGGAGAVAAGLAAMGLAPGQFGVSGNAGWSNLKLMGATFVVSGIIAAAAFLKQSPLPAIETTVSASTTTQPGAPPSTTVTVS